MRVAVGALTRRRPKMFGKLLDSFATMHRPDGGDVVFVFVENDSKSTIVEQINTFRARVPEEVRLELEPTVGIPMGRNKALDMAIEAGADFLTFVDDDEVVTEDWLVNLITGMDERGLDLAGAPVHLIAPVGEMTAWNAAVLKHLQERSEKRNRSRCKAAEAGKDGELDIYTNNWCMRLEAQKQLGIRFDETLQFTGGSDTKFSLDAKASHAAIGWVADAVVKEPTPQKRLTLPYHFRRARDQSINGVHLHGKSLTQSLTQVLLRSVEAALHAVSSLVRGRYGLVRAVHKVGLATGRLRGAFGGRSGHYDVGAARFHAEMGE